LDGIVGASGKVNLDNQKMLYFSYYGDVGTGDSDLTWSVQGILGYRLNKRWNLQGGYRFVRWNFESGDSLSTLNVRGPIFGATYKF